MSLHKLSHHKTQKSARKAAKELKPLGWYYRIKKTKKGHTLYTVK